MIHVSKRLTKYLSLGKHLHFSRWSKIILKDVQFRVFKNKTKLQSFFLSSQTIANDNFECLQNKNLDFYKVHLSIFYGCLVELKVFVPD